MSDDGVRDVLREAYVGYAQVLAPGEDHGTTWLYRCQPYSGPEITVVVDHRMAYAIEDAIAAGGPLPVIAYEPWQVQE